MGAAPNPAATTGVARFRFLALLRVRAVRADSFGKRFVGMGRCH